MSEREHESSVESVERAAQRSMGRALREERLALAVLAKIFLLEVPNPDRLLARIGAVVRSASTQKGFSQEARQALIDCERLVRNALARELGRPQTLMDPPGWMGHVNPRTVDKVISGEPIGQQLGLSASNGDLTDVAEAQTDRMQTVLAVHDKIVEALKEGPATERVLYQRYIVFPDAPPHSPRALTERRRELTQSGRVKDTGVRVGTEPVWALVEDKAKVKAASDPKNPTWKKEGRTRDKVPCPECGKPCGFGAGLAMHLKSKHGYSVGQRRMAQDKIKEENSAE